MYLTVADDIEYAVNHNLNIYNVTDYFGLENRI